MREIADGKDAPVPSTIEDESVLDTLRPVLRPEGLTARHSRAAAATRPMGGCPVQRRDVVILGSTGSIGTQALDLVRANPDRFRVVGLTAGGSQPGAVRAAGRRVRARPSPASARRPPSRRPALACDVVLNGITGAVGLRPTLAALDAGNTLALANKESLIIGGPLVTGARDAGPDRARRLRALARSPSACAAAAPRRYAGWC